MPSLPHPAAAPRRGPTWRLCGFDRATERLSCEIAPSCATVSEIGSLLGLDVASPETAGSYPIDLDALDVMTGTLVAGSPDDVDGCDWFFEQVAA